MTTINGPGHGKRRLASMSRIDDVDEDAKKARTDSFMTCRISSDEENESGRGNVVCRKRVSRFQFELAKSERLLREYRESYEQALTKLECQETKLRLQQDQLKSHEYVLEEHRSTILEQSKKILEKDNIINRLQSRLNSVLCKESNDAEGSFDGEDELVTALDQTNHVEDKGKVKAHKKSCVPKKHPSGLNTGRWTAEEHCAFLKGLEKHGRKWKSIAIDIKTRTVVQTRTHAQKYFQKLSRIQGLDAHAMYLGKEDNEEDEPSAPLTGENLQVKPTSTAAKRRAASKAKAHAKAAGSSKDKSKTDRANVDVALEYIRLHHGASARLMRQFQTKQRKRVPGPSTDHTPALDESSVGLDVLLEAMQEYETTQ